MKFKKIRSRKPIQSGKVGKNYEQNKFVQEDEGSEPNRADKSLKKLQKNKGPYRKAMLKGGYK